MKIQDSKKYSICGLVYTGKELNEKFDGNAQQLVDKGYLMVTEMQELEEEKLLPVGIAFLQMLQLKSESSIHDFVALYRNFLRKSTSLTEVIEMFYESLQQLTKDNYVYIVERHSNGPSFHAEDYVYQMYYGDEKGANEFFDMYRQEDCCLHEAKDGMREYCQVEGLVRAIHTDDHSDNFPYMLTIRKVPLGVDLERKRDKEEMG